MSCCGRGGSWFKNCGRAGNTKFQHTWYEGIQACKSHSQFKTVIDNQLKDAQQQGMYSSQGADMENYTSIIAVTDTFVFASVHASTPTSDTKSIVTSTYTPANLSIIISAAHTLMTKINAVFNPHVIHQVKHVTKMHKDIDNHYSYLYFVYRCIHVLMISLI